jgi:hypothetical protein
MTPKILRAIVRKLRRMLAGGATLRVASRVLNVSTSAAFLIADKHNLPRRRRGLSPPVRRKILRLLAESDLTHAKISRLVRVHKGTISRIAAKRLRSSSAPHRRLRKPRKCEEGHRVVVWPCLICAAKRSANKSPRARGDLG